MTSVYHGKKSRRIFKMFQLIIEKWRQLLNGFLEN